MTLVRLAAALAAALATSVSAQEAPPPAPACPTAAAAPPAAAPPPPSFPPASWRHDPRFTLDASLHLGETNSVEERRPILGFGLHVTARPRRVILAGSAELSTLVVGESHLFATLGAGTAFSHAKGRLVVLGLYGSHIIDSSDVFGEGESHELKTLGARVAWEADLGRWLMLRGALSATGYVDLERAWDSHLGSRVGGAALVLAIAVGLGV